MIFWLFTNILSVAGIFCTLIGMLTVFHWFKSAKAPNDSSNRINNIKSWWIGLTRPDVLGRSYKAFRQDEMDNIKDVER
jgi:hypothetical protein